jgi:hypothetical protein
MAAWPRRRRSRRRWLRDVVSLAGEVLFLVCNLDAFVQGRGGIWRYSVCVCVKHLQGEEKRQPRASFLCEEGVCVGRLIKSIESKERKERKKFQTPFSRPCKPHLQSLKPVHPIHPLFLPYLQPTIAPLDSSPLLSGQQALGYYNLQTPLPLRPNHLLAAVP